MIVGVTDGQKAETDAWVEQHGVTYPWGIDTGYAWVSALNIWSYPYALLLAPSGLLLWSGHPNQVTEAMLESHLGSVVGKPLWAWPAELEPVKRAFLEGSYGRARTLVTELAEKEPKWASWRGELDLLIKIRCEALTSVMKAGDFATTLALGRFLQESLAGHREANDAEAVIERVMFEDDALSIARAQEQVRALRNQQPKTAEEFERVLGELRELAKEHPKTAVATEVKSAVGCFERMRQHPVGR